MLRGNVLQNALISAGLAETPKPKRHKHSRKYKCHNCGKQMYFPDNTNVMSCECGQFFIFDVV